MTRRRDRQRLSSPFVRSPDRLVGGALEGRASARLWAEADTSSTLRSPRQAFRVRPSSAVRRRSLQRFSSRAHRT
jgi:hypothetical protein